MTEWLPALATRLARGEACVLVTVAHTVGSTHREAGATMLVGAQASLGSIGGGADEIMLGIICKLMGILPGKKK